MTARPISTVGPLLYLTGRSLVNGVRRAFSSGKRVIGLLFSFAYIFFALFNRFILNPPRHRAGAAPAVEIPPHIFDTIAFGLFSLITIFNLMRVLSYRGSFRPPDVDVLFPTPLSVRVMLIYRLLRDFLLNMLGQIFFLFLTTYSLMAEGKSAFRGPQGGFAMVAIAFILLNLTFTVVGYAVSMFVDRADDESERNRKRIKWGIGVLVVGFMLVALGLTRLGGVPLENLAQHPLLRIWMLPATAATAIASLPIASTPVWGVLGILALLAISGVALRAAISQEGWLYDQAAVRGFDGMEMKQKMRSGDVSGIWADHARKGKVKRGRLAPKLAAMTVRGGAAIAWRDLLIQLRTQWGSNLMFAALTAFYVGGALALLGTTKRPPPIAPLYLGALAFSVYLTAMSLSMGGFVEFLKKVDVTKPLPFPPRVVVFWEVVPKVTSSLISVLVATVALLVMRPGEWLLALAGLLMTPALALAIISMVMLVSVLFPDFEDPTQRSFRGLMILVGIAIGIAPGLAVIGAALIFGAPLLVGALIFGIIEVAIALIACGVAGHLYQDFNPSE